MQTNKTTNILLAIIALVLIVGLGYFFTHQNAVAPVVDNSAADGTPAQTQTDGTSNGTPPSTPVTPPGMKPYTDTSFGFTLSYPASYTLLSDPSGAVNLGIPGSEVPIKIVKTTNTAPDSNGKWGPYTVSYGTTGFVVQQQDEQTGSMTLKSITPIAYTTSGLPIFNGGMPSHGWGTYDYIVALSHTKFLTISGPDMVGDAAYNASTDPTFAIAKSVTQ